MDKFSSPSTHKYAVSLTEKNDFTIDNEPLFLPKKVFLTIVSETAGLLLNFHQKRQKKYQKIMENLNRRIGNQPKGLHNSKLKRTTVSNEIIEIVLLKLNSFENNKGYLDASVNLNSLSGSLGTNSSYLSKIINHTKGKSFKKYLNDLRIGHAYTELKNDPQKVNYTIEAIAFDFGFKSAENFSKKFKAAYGILPSKFMKDIYRSG